MKNVFGTSLFWLLVFVVAITYVKMFNAPLGMEVATWLATAPVSPTQLSDVQSAVLSGLNVMQGTDEQLQVSLDAISAKLGIPLSLDTPMQTGENTTVVVSGSAIVPATTTGVVPPVKAPSKVLKK